MGRIEPHELDGTLQQLTEPAAIAEAAQLQEQVGNNFSSQDHSTCRMVGNTVIGHPWTTGLFDCHEHQTNAIMTAILPCVTFGQIAEILDGGEMTCLLGSFIYLLMMPALCSQWIMGSKYRTKILADQQEVEKSFDYWGSVEGDYFHPAECMQQLLEQVRRHRINIDGNACTVMVTTSVLEVFFSLLKVYHCHPSQPPKMKN
ncbi:hypothetical protein F0562_030575 [Nyssa sinensis]|uniref:Uncharacterized protein n=1 Tax=Nyssa sinensis TaxID=561372 RepID=A0A5J5B139_9ASTE|nr:hypothetical protein F0562_030575 [Nyssa sinensis]